MRADTVANGIGSYEVCADAFGMCCIAVAIRSIAIVVCADSIAVGSIAIIVVTSAIVIGSVAFVVPPGPL